MTSKTPGNKQELTTENTSTALVTQATLAEMALREIAEKNAMALVGNSAKTALQRLQEMEEMMETPFISGTAAGEVETIVSVHRVGEGEIESIQEPGKMIQKYLFLCTLQTSLAYTSKARELKAYEAGTRVIIALAKTNRREMFADIVRTMNTEEPGQSLTDILIRLIPARKPGQNAAVSFKSLSKVALVSVQ